MDAGVVEFPNAANVRNKSKDRPIQHGTPGRRPGQGPSIAIGVTSVQRSVEKDRAIRVGYLTQVISALHRLTKEDDNFQNHRHMYMQC